MDKNVIVIGGGIIGLSCAYYLRKEGHTVTVIDKSNMSGGASYVNAGYLTPSHIIPLASPGMMAKGIKYMFNSSSPFYMKPRLDPDFMKWAWQFNRSATRANVEKAIPLIRDVNLLSMDLFSDMHESGEFGDFHLEKEGLLMLFKNTLEGQKERNVMQRAIDIGLDASEISRTELDKIQPNLDRSIQGAIHYRCDAHTSPVEFMGKLKGYLTAQGVVIKMEEEVTGFSVHDSTITAVKTGAVTYPADEVVLASGSWSQGLAKKLGLRLSVQPGKGYRINVARPTGIKIPAILMEAKVAVTPMKGFTRFAGTMELSGINHTIHEKRVRAIAQAAMGYYEGLEISEEELKDAQCGLRPVSPDGLPYIGRIQPYKNLAVATGHAMMGWSLLRPQVLRSGPQYY
jgi:D-amino-acid dehydrogenase